MSNSYIAFDIAVASTTDYVLPLAVASTTLVNNIVFNVTAADENQAAITSFQRPLGISFIMPGLSEQANLGVYFFIPNTKKWSLIAGSQFDYSGQKITVETDHLTLFGVFETIDNPTELLTPETVEATSTPGSDLPVDDEPEEELPDVFTTCEDFVFHNGDIIKGRESGKIYVIIGGKKKQIRTRIRFADLSSQLVPEEALDCYPNI